MADNPFGDLIPENQKQSNSPEQTQSSNPFADLVPKSDSAPTEEGGLGGPERVEWGEAGPPKPPDTEPSDTPILDVAREQQKERDAQGMGDVAWAGVKQGTSALSESVWRTPETAKRFLIDLPNQSADWALEKLGMDKETWQPGKLRTPGVSDVVDFTSAKADEVRQWRNTQARRDPAFAVLEQKGKAAEKAVSNALNGDFSGIGQVLADPKAWAGFMGQAAPTLAAAALSGGSTKFLAWLEGMDAANNAAEFEQRTGVKLSPAEYARAVTQQAAVNAVLERTGLDAVLGVKPGQSLVTAFAKGAFSEGGTEFLQELNANLAARGYDEGRKLTHGLLQSFMGGAATGGPAASARQAVSNLAPRDEGLSEAASNRKRKARRDQEEAVLREFEEAAAQAEPEALPRPVMEADSEGNVGTEAQQANARAEREQRGLTPDVERAAAKHPGRAGMGLADVSAESAGEQQSEQAQSPESDRGEGGRALANKLAELDRLAKQAQDPNVRAELERQRENVRQELMGREPKLTPKERAAKAREVNPREDDLATAIQKLGGINIAEDSDWAGRLKGQGTRRPGLPSLERPAGKGRSLDDLAEPLHELGYIQSRDKTELEEKLSRVERGERVNSIERADEEAEAEYQRMAEQRAQGETPQLEPVSGMSVDEVMSAMEEAEASGVLGRMQEDAAYPDGADHATRVMDDVATVADDVDSDRTEKILEDGAKQGRPDQDIVRDLLQVIREGAANAQQASREGAGELPQQARAEEGEQAPALDLEQEQDGVAPADPQPDPAPSGPVPADQGPGDLFSTQTQTDLEDQAGRPTKPIQGAKESYTEAESLIGRLREAGANRTADSLQGVLDNNREAGRSFPRLTLNTYQREGAIEQAAERDRRKNESQGLEEGEEARRQRGEASWSDHFGNLDQSRFDPELREAMVAAANRASQQGDQATDQRLMAQAARYVKAQDKGDEVTAGQALNKVREAAGLEREGPDQLDDLAPYRNHKGQPAKDASRLLREMGVSERIAQDQDFTTTARDGQTTIRRDGERVTISNPDVGTATYTLDEYGAMELESARREDLAGGSEGGSAARDVIATVRSRLERKPEKSEGDRDGGQDYDARVADRVERIRNADSREAVDAIQAEEHADGERHMEGTTQVDQAAAGRRAAFSADEKGREENPAIKRMREQGWEPASIGLPQGATQSRALKTVKDLNERSHSQEFTVVTTGADGDRDFSVMRRDIPGMPHPPKDGWRESLMKAREYARGLGVPAEGKTLDQIVADVDERLTQQRIVEAREEVNTEPTDGQKDAGNYRKGHVSVNGLDVSIENPKGSTRSGTDGDGNQWESTMAHDYGDIKGTRGADGDEIDVFLGPRAGRKDLGAFVIDQVNPKTGEFDEHKVMLGFDSARTARKGYLDNYEAGWPGIGGVREMSVDELKDWLRDGDTTKALTDLPEANQDRARIREGVKPLVQREQAARQSFVDSVTEQFGLSEDDARAALATLERQGVVKINAVNGDFTLKDGRFWDEGVMRRAADAENVRAPEKSDEATDPATFVARDMMSDEFMPVDVTTSKVGGTFAYADGTKVHLVYGEATGDADNTGENYAFIYPAIELPSGHFEPAEWHDIGRPGDSDEQIKRLQDYAAKHIQAVLDHIQARAGRIVAEPTEADLPLELRAPDQGQQAGEAQGEPELYIEDFTNKNGETKSIIVKGNTREHKERIKAAIGKRPMFHRQGRGWLFPKAREAEVREALADLLGEGDTRTAAPAEGRDRGETTQVREIGVDRYEVTDTRHPALKLTVDVAGDDGHASAYMETSESPSEVGGRGGATTLYLMGLKLAQSNGVGWQADNIASDATARMYERLRELGVPFDRSGRPSISADALGEVDLDAITRRWEARKEQGTAQPAEEGSVPADWTAERTMREYAARAVELGLYGDAMTAWGRKNGENLGKALAGGQYLLLTQETAPELRRNREQFEADREAFANGEIDREAYEARLLERLRTASRALAPVSGKDDALDFDRALADDIARELRNRVGLTYAKRRAALIDAARTAQGMFWNVYRAHREGRPYKLEGDHLARLYDTAALIRAAGSERQADVSYYLRSGSAFDLDPYTAFLARMQEDLGLSAEPGALPDESEPTTTTDEGAIDGQQPARPADATGVREAESQIRSGVPGGQTGSESDGVRPVRGDEGEAGNAGAEPAADAEQVSRHRQLAEGVAAKIRSAVENTAEGVKFLSSNELFDMAARAYGGTMADGVFTSKDAYDALELGLNLYLTRNPGDFDPRLSRTQPARDAVDRLQALQARLPSQTKRTEETQQLQQFSTAHGHSYVAAWVANLTENDRVLEPSAGTGNLVTHAENAGVDTVYVNELSERRAEALRSLLDDAEAQVFTENANHLNAVLPASVRPSVVLMNPPFSADVNKPGKKDLGLGAKHMEQALARLEDGGRLVAILGRGMAMDRPRAKPYWNRIKDSYNVRANVGISGSEYQKQGTSFDNRIVVIDKTGPTTDANILSGDVSSVGELIPLLEGVRNDRTPAAEPPRDQPRGEERAQDTGRDTRSDGAVRGTTDSLGFGDGQARPGGEGRGGAAQRRGADTGGREPEGGDAAAAGNRGRDQGDQQSAGAAGSAARDRGADAGAETARGSGRQQSDVPGSEVVPDPGTVEARIEALEDQHTELAQSVFENYRPKYRVEGAQKHPADLSESAAMSAVNPPKLEYSPRIPKKVIDEGKLSDIQLEAIAYAGQAHEQRLPDTFRKGYFIGDGTGVGKGAEIAGIMLDNWQRGRRRHVWVSENQKLFKDAQRDADWVGLGKGKLINQGDVASTGAIQADEGVIFTTYSTLRSASKPVYDAAGNLERDSQRRIDQLVDWLGQNFDGVVAFDEAHNMRNAVDMEQERGVKKASQAALAGIELQRALPNARVVYVSATGATEVSNLAYGERLGLWGQDTAFPTKESFIDEIESGGVAAMEVVSRDMKAMGVYAARSLSFEGVEYDMVEHQLTDEQRRIYDTLAEGWQRVYENIEQVLQDTGAKNDGNAKGRAKSAFWGAQQRFFNQVLTGMQVPAVIEDVERQLQAGNSAVLQLVSTNEAVQERRMAQAAKEGLSLEEVDATPRDILMQYLQQSFPTTLYESYFDSDGNERWRPVLDANDNPVQDPDAVAKRDKLLEDLGSVEVPEGVLEQITSYFGTDAVAEITGRSQRLVRKPDGSTELEKLTAKKMQRDADAFMAGDKRILVFSDAGGTGRSYHADLRAKNQQKRIHYLVQPGWRADKAVQGFGRTHRTNQAQPPEYRLVTTDLKAQRRFLSSIARRLDQLGALTRGQRDTASQGMFSADMNLENEYAKSAVSTLVRDALRGEVDGVEPQVLEKQMGLDMRDADGSLVESKIPNVPQFLNRLLSLKTDTMNTVFDAFFARLQANIEYAESQGTLDVGMETLTAESVTKADESTANVAGNEIRHVELALTDQVEPLHFDDLPHRDGKTKFARQKRSGRLYAIRQAANATDQKTGAVIRRMRRIAPSKADYITRDEYLKKYEDVTDQSEEQIRALWEAEVEQAPRTKTRSEHLIVGTLLPVWDRLPRTGRTRIMRAQTDDGERFIGREIPKKNLDDTLRALGMGRKAPELTPKQAVAAVMDKGQTLVLSNGWQLQRRRVSGEPRIEVIGAKGDDTKALKDMGAFTEVISFRTRVFVPVSDAADVFKRIFASKPIQDVAGVETETRFARYTDPDEQARAQNPQDGIGESRESAGLREGLARDSGGPGERGGREAGAENARAAGSDLRESVQGRQEAGIEVEESLGIDPAFVAGLSGEQLRTPAIREMAAEAYREQGTDSPFFQAWFGNSKIRNKRGEPVTVYHATSAEPFEAFDRSRIGSSTGYGPSGLGFFFTNSREQARNYGERIMPVYLRMENPYRMRVEDMDFGTIEEARAFADKLQRQGYDGIVAKAPTAPGESPQNYIVAFDPKQIKSTRNVGTFNRYDDRIRFARAGMDFDPYSLSVDAAIEQARDLAPQVEDAYERGFFDRAMHLDARLEALYARIEDGLAEREEDGPIDGTFRPGMEGAQTEYDGVLTHDSEAVLEKDLARAYAEVQKNSITIAEDTSTTEGAANYLRGVLSDHGLLDTSAFSDEQIVEAARDAYERERALRERRGDADAVKKAGEALASIKRRESGKRFRRGGPSVDEVMARREIEAAVSGLMKGWKQAPPVEVVQSERDLEPAVRNKIRRAGASGEIKGVFHDGEVFLIADNIATTEQAEAVVVHEIIGHYGVRGVLGEDGRRVFNQVAMAKRTEVAEVADRLGLDMRDAEQRREAAEEYIAEQAEAGKGSKLMDKVVGAVRDWLRRMGFKLRLRDADIASLIARSRRFVSTGQATRQSDFTSVDGLVFSRGKPERVRVPTNTARWMGGTTLPVQADFESLKARHPEYYDTPNEAREDVLYALNAPEDWFEHAPGRIVLTRARKDHIVGVRLDLRQQQGSGYPVTSVYHMSWNNVANKMKAKRKKVEALRRVGRIPSSSASGSIASPGRLSVADYLAAEGHGSWPPTSPSGDDRRASTGSSVEGGGEDGNPGTRFARASVGPMLYGRGQRGQLAGVARKQGGSYFVWVREGAGGDLFEQGPRKFTEPTVAAARKRLESFGLEVGVEVPQAERVKRQPLFTDGFVTPDDTVFDYVRYKLQDKYVDLAKVEDTIQRVRGEQLEDATDAYLQEELYHGRAEARVDDFREQHVEPLLEAIREAGVSFDGFDEYLYARHAKERNERMSQINPDLEPGEGSGMTDAEAEAIIESHEQDGSLDKLEELAQRVDRINELSRDELVVAGLEKEETVEAWRQAYDYYVPLRGGVEAPSRHGRGRGFDVRGRMKRAFGRRSRAESPLTNVVAQHEATLIRAEKARVGRALLRLVQANPNPSLWEIGAAEYMPKINPATGLVEQVPDPLYRLKENVLAVKVAGEEHHITFHGERGERIAAAMKNLGLENNGLAVRALGAVNRWLSLVNTGANPEFVISNFARDLQTAGINLAGTEANEVKGRVLRDTLNGRAWRGIRRAQKGKHDTEWARAFDEFRRAGGKTGWVDTYAQTEEAYKKLHGMMRDMQSSRFHPMRAGKAVLEFIEDENTAVENAVRLSAYKHAREAGVSEQRAASLAKNLTVNFNRKGDYGVMMNAFYLFYNASMQGSVRMIQALGNPRVRKIAVGIVAFAAVMDMINRAVGGEDEDGRPHYDKLPDYVKNGNMVFMDPGGSGSYVSIPLPYGYNVLHVFGSELGEALAAASDQKQDYSVGESMVNVLSTALSSFNPLGSEASLTQVASPTVTDPLVQVSENSDFAGRPIYPEANPFTLAPAPDAYRHWETTPKAATWVAKQINDLTGGSSDRPGAVDVSPDVMMHYYEFLTGGAGRFVQETLQAPSALSSGTDLRPYQIPFLGKIYGNQGSRATTNAFYENVRQIRYAEAEVETSRQRKNVKRLQDLRRRYRGELSMSKMATEVREELREIREKREKIENSRMAQGIKRRQLDKLDEREEDLMMKFNRIYYRRTG